MSYEKYNAPGKCYYFNTVVDLFHLSLGTQVNLKSSLKISAWFVLLFNVTGIYCLL